MFSSARCWQPLLKCFVFLFVEILLDTRSVLSKSSSKWSAISAHWRAVDDGKRRGKSLVCDRVSTCSVVPNVNICGADLWQESLHSSHFFSRETTPVASRTEGTATTPVLLDPSFLQMLQYIHLSRTSTSLFQHLAASGVPYHDREL